jgi:phytoene dehydrogenase-like protein
MVFQPVQEIYVDNNRVARGVVLQDGTHIQSKIVLSNATAKVTFSRLINEVRNGLMLAE